MYLAKVYVNFRLQLYILLSMGSNISLYLLSKYDLIHLPTQAFDNIHLFTRAR